MRKKRRRLSLEIFGESFRDGSRRVLGAGARRLLRADDTCERLDVITSGIFHRGEDSSSEIWRYIPRSKMARDSDASLSCRLESVPCDSQSAVAHSGGMDSPPPDGSFAPPPVLRPSRCDPKASASDPKANPGSSSGSATRSNSGYLSGTHSGSNPASNPASNSASNSASNRITDNWSAAWLDRFECWWVSIGVEARAQLWSCLGSLALYLSRRLTPQVDGWQSEGGQSEGGQCEWLLEGSADALKLPPFPDLPVELELEFRTLPPKTFRILPSRLYTMIRTRVDPPRVAAPARVNPARVDPLGSNLIGEHVMGGGGGGAGGGLAGNVWRPGRMASLASGGAVGVSVAALSLVVVWRMGRRRR